MADPIRIFIDGACQPNPGSMGLGVVVEWQGKAPTILSEYGGEGTNNIAEYMALHLALEFIKTNAIRIVDIKCDSALVVNQLKTKKPWQCNNILLIPFRDKALRRFAFLGSLGYVVSLEYIPRELNLADEPAKAGCKKKNVKK
jgi:ribonuclease HI